MYVNPFRFGVLVTVVIEIVALIGYSVVITSRGKRR